ncbi:MAG: hypothetical protein EOO72_00935, partial [Myxococcaceae bacterium]
MSVRAGVVGAGLAVIACLSVGCGDNSPTVDPQEDQAPGPPGGNEFPTEPPPGSSTDGGTLPPEEDGGATPDDGGTPDAGPTPVPDGGEPPDAGPWPVDATLDYTRTFGVGTPQSVGIDEGLNVWLLDGYRIGVLRPGDKAP